MDFEKLAEGLTYLRKEAKAPRYIRELARKGLQAKTPGAAKELDLYQRGTRLGKERAHDIAALRKATNMPNSQAARAEYKKARRAIDSKSSDTAARMADIGSQRRAPINRAARAAEMDRDRAAIDRVRRLTDRRYTGRFGKARKYMDTLFPKARLRKEKALRNELVYRGRLGQVANMRVTAKDKIKAERARSREVGRLAPILIPSIAFTAGGLGYASGRYKKRKALK